MTLTIQQELRQHEMADERRFGQIEKHLTRIEGKIDVLAIQVTEARKIADSASDEVEATGKHASYEAEKRAEFWKKLIAGVLSALFIAGVSGAVSYALGVKSHNQAGVHP